jgi:DinB superfamily
MEERLSDVKEVLLSLLHESYDKFAWHGPNLLQALNGVNAAQANWRPPPDGAMLWNIREIVLHVAGNMRECGASLLGRDERTLKTAREESFPLSDLQDDEEWKREIDFLQKSFDVLQQAVSAFTPARLNEQSPSTAYRRSWTFQNHVYGVALHNIYHAAQIVSLRKRQHRWTELA